MKRWYRCVLTGGGPVEDVLAADHEQAACDYCAGNHFGQTEPEPGNAFSIDVVELVKDSDEATGSLHRYLVTSTVSVCWCAEGGPT